MLFYWRRGAAFSLGLVFWAPEQGDFSVVNYIEGGLFFFFSPKAVWSCIVGYFPQKPPWRFFFFLYSLLCSSTLKSKIVIVFSDRGCGFGSYHCRGSLFSLALSCFPLVSMLYFWEKGRMKKMIQPQATLFWLHIVCRPGRVWDGKGRNEVNFAQMWKYHISEVNVRFVHLSGLWLLLLTDELHF